MSATVYVDLKQAPLSKLPGRPQRWYWVARNAGNQKKLARSSERYTNRQDCLNAIRQLFGDATDVFLREAEKGNYPLRRALP